LYILSVRKEKTANLISGLAIMLISGILYMWSVFQPYVMAHFGWSSGDVAMTSSLMIACFVIGNVLAGLVQEKFRPRNIVLLGGIMFAAGMLLTSFLTSAHPWMLYVTYSLISGLGVGAAYCTVLYALQKWYAAKTGMITGLTVCFFGLSVVILAPVARALLSGLGVPATFRMLSLVFILVILVAGHFVSQPSTSYYLSEASKVLRKDEFKQFRPSEMVRTPLYWLQVISMFLTSAAYLVLVPYITTIAVSRGMSEQMALVAVMGTGVGNSLGRIIAPSVSDKLGRTVTIILCCIISALACLAMISANGLLYVLAVFLIAFSYGGTSGTNPVIATELFGAKYSGTNYGLVMISIAASSVVFGKISAVVGASSGGDFTAVFILCAAVCVVPIVLMLLMRRFCMTHGGKRI
jgi:OFA family oxalate/formate antiporter-like MFS transporter